MEQINTFLKSYPGISVERMADGRWFLNYLKPVQAGIKLTVEITVSALTKEAIKIYQRNKWIPKKTFKPGMNVFWVRTLIQTDDGFFGEHYNPQIEYVPAIDQSCNPPRPYFRAAVDFKWLLPATPENLNRILAEIERRSISA